VDRPVRCCHGCVWGPALGACTSPPLDNPWPVGRGWACKLLFAYALHPVSCRLQGLHGVGAGTK
jgi:hypothetical protein